MSKADQEHAIEQANSQYECIEEMMTKRQAAHDLYDDEKQEQAEQEIHQSPLSVMVRSGWYMPGSEVDSAPEEYEILLCTGGPAVRIVGDLSGGEPDTAHLEHQDWFVPWTRWRGATAAKEETLLAYAQQFYFSA